MKKNLLFANWATWIRLSQTILGFCLWNAGDACWRKALTVFGYGAKTTLPPCIGLTIAVHLLDIEEGTSRTFPALAPLSLNWIQNPEFYRNIEESIRQQPHFAGSFYRDLLDKMEGLNNCSDC